MPRGACMPRRGMHAPSGMHAWGVCMPRRHAYLCGCAWLGGGGGMCGIHIPPADRILDTC